jgi:hypothetical protein
MEVDGALELVQELAFDDVFVDHAFPRLMHGDDAGAIGSDLSNAEWQVDEEVRWILVEATEISPGHVGRASGLGVSSDAMAAWPGPYSMRCPATSAPASES